MKLPSGISYALITFVVVAAVAATSYGLGFRRSKSEIASLRERMELLEEAGKEAAIVKRVSQQMEDIAYQQKAISDQQRDRAEEQSILAMRNARIAEQESRAARQAELKAMEAAQLAQRERANAERQQEIALEQRDQATYAKNVADTLNRRTQARILAVSSMVRREAGESEVADLLAYASWYFLKNNRGNQYFSDTFKSLTQATNGILRYRMGENGAVNALTKVLDAPGQCVAVSNYGEVEWLRVSESGGSRRILSTRLLFDPVYDFRDVKYLNGKIYALSLKGPLCVVDFNGYSREVGLPEDDYFKLVCTEDGRLLLAGRHSLCWYADGDIFGRVELPGNLSAVTERDGAVDLFFEDGAYARMNAAGQIEERQPLLPQAVCYAYYNPSFRLLMLGTADGTLYPVNRYDRVLEVMAAHKSRCAGITMQGANIISGAYDKAVYIWNMDNLKFESGLDFREELEEEFAVTRLNDGKEIPAEWLVPVDYAFDGWTLSVCDDVDGKSVWVGTSTGNVMLLNSSADDMAAQIHAKLKRNLTQQEWLRYVGVSIPYMTFR